jgi:hypothetical protein
MYFKIPKILLHSPCKIQRSCIIYSFQLIFFVDVLENFSRASPKTVKILVHNYKLRKKKLNKSYISNIMDTISKYIIHIESSIANAEKKKSKLIPEILNIPGYTGYKTLHFYNNITNFADCRYLEIGTYNGSSTSAALYGNVIKATCIDNWSEFGGPRDSCMNNIEKYKGESAVSFIESDCWKVDISKLDKFNVYMYDACHEKESQYKALTHYINAMDDVFIYIVDDWDWERVRNGTNEAISALNLKILFKKEIHMVNDGTAASDKENWWNGVGIFLFEKQKVF